MGVSGFLKLCLVTLLLLTGFNATPTLKEKVEAVKFLLPVHLENTEVSWESCGSWNGAYYFDSQDIVLCNENLLEGLEVARMIYLHELGHAYTFKYHTDFSRWGGNYEDAADEFAAVWGVVLGYPEDLVAKARLWEDYARTEFWTPDDPHSPALLRAKRFRELYWGYMFPKTAYGKKWAETLSFWRAELIRNGTN